MDKYIFAFVETIKDYITVNNMTVTEFAKKLGCKEYCVIRWLKGINVPSLEYVIMVADYLKCSVDYVLGLTDNNSYNPYYKQVTFAERFLLMQKKTGKSFNQIAKICGVTSSNISKWILRGQLPKPQTVCILSDYFDCTADYLIGRSD